MERDAFRSLNAFVEPLVRAGFGGPLLLPFGAIVLETTGRRSGQPRRTPLMAAVFDGVLLVSTFRGPRSNWMKNLIARPQANWWVNGVSRTGRAAVFSRSVWPEPSSVGPAIMACAETFWRPLVESGWSVAVLVGDDADSAR